MNTYTDRTPVNHSSSVDWIHWAIPLPDFRDYLKILAAIGLGLAAAVIFVTSFSLGQITESWRIVAALAFTPAWLYLALAVDSEQGFERLLDLLVFLTLAVLAYMVNSSGPQWLAAAFVVHLVWVMLNLWRLPNTNRDAISLLAWGGFSLGMLALLPMIV